MYKLYIECWQNNTYQPNIQKIENIKAYSNDRFRTIQIGVQTAPILLLFNSIGTCQSGKKRHKYNTCKKSS